MALPRIPRLSTFERIQLLLVLWAAAASILKGGMGVSFPGAPPSRVPGLSWGLLGWALLRATSVAMYPLLAFVMSRRVPLWGASRRSIGWHLGTIAALHCVAFLCGELSTWLAGSSVNGGSFYLHTTFEYAVYAVFAHGMQYGERFHEKEREELRLRAEMADSTAARAGAQVRAPHGMEPPLPHRHAGSDRRPALARRGGGQAHAAGPQLRAAARPGPRPHRGGAAGEGGGARGRGAARGGAAPHRARGGAGDRPGRAGSSRTAHGAADDGVPGAPGVPHRCPAAPRDLRRAGRCGRAAAGGCLRRAGRASGARRDRARLPPVHRRRRRAAGAALRGGGAGG